MSDSSSWIRLPQELVRVLKALTPVIMAVLAGLKLGPPSGEPPIWQRAISHLSPPWLASTGA